MKRYVQTIKVNKKDENENDSDADGGGGDDETEITKSYTWDVDRTWDQQTHRPKWTSKVDVPTPAYTDSRCVFWMAVGLFRAGKYSVDPK